MMILLMTGAGLGIGGFVSWLIEKYPNLFVADNTIKKDCFYPKISLVKILFISGLALGFWGLSIGNLAISQTLYFGILLSITWTAAFFDLRYQLIPNRLILFGVVSWVWLVITGSIPLFYSILAATSSAVLMLLIRLLGFLIYKKAGMGMGDIKLVFLMGLFIQWEIFWVIYLAIILGGIWAIAGLVFKKIDRKSRLPFAPFLWIGASITTFFSFDEFISIWI